jgi:hypothetical protein
VTPFPESAEAAGNTRVFFFFFSPFSGGLPKVNTRVFFFFFFRPFLAGCPGLIPEFVEKKEEEGIRLQIFRFFGEWV